MGSLELRDVAKIYPFVETGGLLGRRQRIEQLARQKAMPYVSNEGVIVLQHIDLTIRDGEFLVLLGPSGCGNDHTAAAAERAGGSDGGLCSL